MKKHLLILFLIFISFSNYAQWTGVTDITQISIQSQSQLNAFVDANGIHIVYWRNGGIKYARVKYDGTTVHSYDVTIESEGSNCDFVNVVSVNNSTLYAIYKKNNTINIKRSTNIGSSWSQYSYRDMANSGCDKIVAYNDVGDIHIGWTEYKGNPDYHYESYYIKFTPGAPTPWSYYKEVTDQEYGGGSDPDLTFSTNEIHYLYKDFSSDSRSRDKLKASTNWESPQSIPFDGTSIQYHKPSIANNELNAAFRVYYSSWQTSGAFISNSDRPFDQGYWNENVWLRESEIGYDTEVESTVDSKIHFIYYDKTDSKWEHRYVANSGLSDQIGEITLVAYPSSTLIPNSNDLYLLSLGSVSVPTYIKLQRYNVAPAAPKNLSVSQSENNHPFLTWSANTEPDMKEYKVWKKGGDEGGDWHLKYTTTNTFYEDPDETVVTGPKQTNEGTAYYYVKAVDQSDNISAQSNEVNIRVGIDPPTKSVSGDGKEDLSYEYLLMQNYPNPFNPTTTINYSIKSAGEVTLKIYDMIGAEVASLVNESQEAGSYSVEFNAADLPSGMYVYRLSTNNFVGTKKLLLLK
jgi:hypothetical protein